MWWMVSLMQNEGKTDNRKTMITFLSDNFSASSASRISMFSGMYGDARVPNWPH